MIAKTLEQELDYTAYAVPKYINKYKTLNWTFKHKKICYPCIDPQFYFVTRGCYKQMLNCGIMHEEYTLYFNKIDLQKFSIWYTLSL